MVGMPMVISVKEEAVITVFFRAGEADHGPAHRRHVDQLSGMSGPRARDTYRLWTDTRLRAGECHLVDLVGHAHHQGLAQGSRFSSISG